MSNFLFLIKGLLQEYSYHNGIKVDYELKEEQHYNNIVLTFSITHNDKVIYCIYSTFDKHIYDKNKDEIDNDFKTKILRNLLSYSLAYLTEIQKNG